MYAYTGGDPINFTDPTGLVLCTGSRIPRSTCGDIPGSANVRINFGGGGGGFGGGGGAPPPCDSSNMCEEVRVIGEQPPSLFSNMGVLLDGVLFSSAQIANIIFNETVSLYGDGIEMARIAIANIAINRFLAKEKVGDCKATACDFINRMLSDTEKALLQAIKGIVLDVLRQRALGIDPTNGTLLYNYRELGKFGGDFGRLSTLPRFGTQFPIKDGIIGPFRNRCPNTIPACGSDLGGEGIFFVPFRQ